MINGYSLNPQFYYDTFSSAKGKKNSQKYLREKIKIRTNTDILKFGIFTSYNTVKEKIILKALRKGINYMNIKQLEALKYLSGVNVSSGRKYPSIIQDRINKVMMHINDIPSRLH